MEVKHRRRREWCVLKLVSKHVVLFCCVLVFRARFWRSYVVRCCGFYCSFVNISSSQWRLVTVRSNVDVKHTTEKFSCWARCVRTSVNQKQLSLMFERTGIDACVPKPVSGRETSVADARPTFWQGCVETICKPRPRGMGAVGQLRRYRVMEKTVSWRTKHSGQRKQSCVR